MNGFVFSCLIVGILAMIFVTPSLMAIGIKKLANDTVSPKDYLLSCIPIFNQVYAEKAYYGNFRLSTVSVFLFVAGIAFRVVAWLKFYDNETMAVASMIVFWIVVILYFLSQIFFVFTVLKDTRSSEGIKLIIMSVLYPFGQYYIGTSVYNVVKYIKEQANTFT